MGGNSFGKQKAPTAPDFLGAAREQTRANRPNQSTPFANSTWQETSATPQSFDEWAAANPMPEAPRGPGGATLSSEQLNAIQRDAYDKYAANPGSQWTQTVGFDPRLETAASQYMQQLGNQGPLPTGEDARQQAIDSAYNSATSRLDPQYAQREEALRTRLSNQGLVPGTEAYDAAVSTEGRGRTDAYNQAMSSAIGQGTSAGNAIFQQGLQSARQPLEQLQGLQGLLQQPSVPGSGDILGALAQQYGAQQGQYGQQSANKNALMSNLAGLGGAAVAASDERLKQSIERLHFEALPGVPWASWEWKHRPGERAVGVIAQDLQKVRPDLVIEREGLLYVNYQGLAEARRG